MLRHLGPWFLLGILTLVVFPVDSPASAKPNIVLITLDSTRADRIVTANPGCMLQLRAGVDRHGHGQRVSHVVEVLDEAYRAAAQAV